MTIRSSMRVNAAAVFLIMMRSLSGREKSREIRKWSRGKGAVGCVRLEYRTPTALSSIGATTLLEAPNPKPQAPGNYQNSNPKNNAARCAPWCLGIEPSLGFGDWVLELFIGWKPMPPYLSSLKATVASGGRFIRMECSRPIHAVFSLSLPPRFPTLLPP